MDEIIPGHNKTKGHLLNPGRKGSHIRTLWNSLQQKSGVGGGARVEWGGGFLYLRRQNHSLAL